MVGKLKNMNNIGGLIGGGVGLVLLGVGIKSSLYTGKHSDFSIPISLLAKLIVDGGHRAVLFSRLTGIQQKIYEEGLHFR